ncbi:hypothetical protein EYF88_02000 [Paracoccus sediminis]|uniref:Uncharacterized protein n=1 Tax=Paracoccus sediminis TaxID=1214787 RepID=A0A238UQI3_9RHOB|nr:hypothetical protein [Paracoccus sediminis]TBN52996.1 hypothetical protein EYF88_02000 [Paracoccus sediminis]SNR23773.1 hypothetical protein SAMN06265378_101223 [Paracoccus sediminis]
MRRLAVLLAALLVPPTGAQAADPSLCVARIDGRDVPLGYDKDEPGLRDHFSRREVFFTAWGRDTCPSYVVLRSLTPDLTDEQRDPFCLRHDKASDSVIGYDLGRRDAYGRCEKPASTVCKRVNQTRNAAVAITGAATRGAINGLRALPDGSGAVILGGSQGYVSGVLSSIGGAAAALAASPAIAAGAAVSIVAVGGAVYACRD